MANEFPKIKELGLEIHTFPLARRYAAGGIASERIPYVDASDLEKLLSQGVRVYQYTPGKYADWSHEIDQDFGVDKYCNQGLVIGIKPIVKDDAVSLLRELIDLNDGNEAQLPLSWYKRAKAYLGREK